MGWKFEHKDSFKKDLSKIASNPAQDVLLYLNREIGVREDLVLLEVSLVICGVIKLMVWL